MDTGCFLAVNFFLTASISVRLDPFFFLSEAVNSGHYQFAGELETLQGIQEKLHKKSSVEQGHNHD